MTVKIRFSRRGRGVVVIEPRDLPESEASILDKFYESYGVRDVAWIREVNEHGRYIIVLPPTYFIPIYTSGEEIQWPEWL